MAINFYHSRDNGPTSPSGSLFMFRSSSRNPKITMLVEISADHDGLGLSKTSVASKEDHSPDGSQLSLSSLPGSSSSPLDDDAVTVSSSDTRGPKGKERDHSSLFIWNSTSHSAGSSSSNKPPLKLSRSRSFTLGSHVSSTEEETSWGSARVRLNGRSSDSLVNTVNSYPDEPLAVLERLRLDQSILETERGKAWLQNRNTPQGVMLGAVSSQSNDSFPLNTESILHQKDERGKSDHNVTSYGSSKSIDKLADETVNEVQPSKLQIQIQETAPLLNFPDSDNATPHLLVPEEVTDCSECGNILDQIKYICTTCGEKTPMSRTTLAAVVKSRASPDFQADFYYRGDSMEYELKVPPYSPRAYPSQATLYVPSSANLPIHFSNTKPLPPILSNPPTPTIFSKTFGSQSILVPPGSSGSSSPTTRVGYELCAMCFERVGLYHTLPGGMYGPTFLTLQRLALARRSAPARKEDLRHAFLFQMWGFHGWQDVGNCLSFCIPCSGELNIYDMNRAGRYVGSLFRVSVAIVGGLL